MLRSIVAVLLLLAVPAHAQGWPDRPLRIVVPFPPGGSNDAFARGLAERLQPQLGQPVVVDNRSGAGGVLGSGQVAQAAPDGQTFLFVSSSFVTSAAVQKTPYDAVDSFTPVALVAAAPMLMVTAPASGIRSLPELLAKARANPGRLHFGSSGPGSINQFGGELLNLRAQVKMEHIAYRGMGPATADLLAGRVELLVTTVASVAGPLRGGQLTLLAYTGANRVPEEPNVPTAREAGLDYTMEIWWGLFGPRGLPAPVTAKLNAAVNTVLGDPAFAKFLAVEGASPAPGTPESFGQRVAGDLARYRELARIADIKAE